MLRLYGDTAERFHYGANRGALPGRPFNFPTLQIQVLGNIIYHTKEMNFRLESVE
jgi:hypothetical protein